MPSTPAQPKRWTTRDLLAWMADAFKAKDLDSPRLCAEMLIAHVIGCDRLKLYLDQDRPASPIELQTLRDLTGRALKHEPVQYLVGEGWFFGMPLHVDSRVLIPRPSTETIVEDLLSDAKARGHEFGEELLIADVCTGSGCIAAAVAKNLPSARVLATDISTDALAVAATNLARHELTERVELLKGDLLAPLHDHPAVGDKRTLAYIATNPPYIPDHEWHDVAPNVKDHEPHSALRAGPTGLDLVRPLIEHAAAILLPGGTLYLELAASHAAEARDIAEATGAYDDPRIVRDLEGHDRVLIARAR